MKGKKLKDYNKKLIRGLNKVGLNPFYPVIQDAQKSKSKINNQEMVIFGTNDYLGLSQHEEVKQAAIESLKKYGTSCCGSRILNGNTELHITLEKKIAKFSKKEDAIVFATGMQTNFGGLSLFDEDCVLVMDKQNHASIVDGARLSKASVVIYEHDDMEDLEKKLIDIGEKYKKIIVTDGVFSMSGKIANIPKIIELKKKYNAKLYLDDAHGIGVVNQGQGSAEKYGLQDDVDYYMGVFSKSFGAIGGFIAGSEEDIFELKYCARSMLFSAALPPVLVGAILKSLDIIKNDKSIFERLEKNIHLFKNEINKLGYDLLPSETAIQSMVIGDEKKLMAIIKYLKKQGVFATPVIPPGVEKGGELIRCSVTALHEEDDLKYAIEKFAEVKELFNI